MRPFPLAILLAMLFAILLVQALPQVVVLMTAFNADSSPVEIHAQCTAVPAVAAVGLLYLFSADLQRQIGRLGPFLSPDSAPGIAAAPIPSIRV